MSAGKKVLESAASSGLAAAALAGAGCLLPPRPPSTCDAAVPSSVCAPYSSTNLSPSSGSWTVLWRPEDSSPSGGCVSGISLHPWDKNAVGGGESAKTASVCSSSHSEKGDSHSSSVDGDIEKGCDEVKRKSFTQCLDVAEREIRARMLGRTPFPDPPPGAETLSPGGQRRFLHGSPVHAVSVAEEDRKMSLAMVNLGAGLARDPDVQRAIARQLSRMPIPSVLEDSDDEGDHECGEHEEIDININMDMASSVGSSSYLMRSESDVHRNCREDEDYVLDSLLFETDGGSLSQEQIKERILKSVQERLSRLTASLEEFRQENLELRKRLAETKEDKDSLEQLLRSELQHEKQANVSNSRNKSRKNKSSDVGQAVHSVLRGLANSENAKEGTNTATPTETISIESQPMKCTPVSSPSLESEKERRQRRRRWYKWAAGVLAGVIVAAATAIYYGINPFTLRRKLDRAAPVFATR